MIKSIRVQMHTAVMIGAFEHGYFYKHNQLSISSKFLNEKKPASLQGVRVSLAVIIVLSLPHLFFFLAFLHISIGCTTCKNCFILSPTRRFTSPPPFAPLHSPPPPQILDLQHQKYRANHSAQRPKIRCGRRAVAALFFFIYLSFFSQYSVTFRYPSRLPHAPRPCLHPHRFGGIL